MSAVEEMMCVVCVNVTEGHSSDEYVLASILCKYTLRKGDFFCYELGKGRRVRQGSRALWSS